jgi:hypothetical protein
VIDRSRVGQFVAPQDHRDPQNNLANPPGRERSDPVLETSLVDRRPAPERRTSRHHLAESPALASQHIVGHRRCLWLFEVLGAIREQLVETARDVAISPRSDGRAKYPRENALRDSLRSLAAASTSVSRSSGMAMAVLWRAMVTPSGTPTEGTIRSYPAKGQVLSGLASGSWTHHMETQVGGRHLSHHYTVACAGVSLAGINRCRLQARAGFSGSVSAASGYPVSFQLSTPPMMKRVFSKPRSRNSTVARTDVA